MNLAAQPAKEIVDLVDRASHRHEVPDLVQCDRPGDWIGPVMRPVRQRDRRYRVIGDRCAEAVRRDDRPLATVVVQDMAQDVLTHVEHFATAFKGGVGFGIGGPGLHVAHRIGQKPRRPDE